MASSSTSEVQVQEVTPTLNGLPKELKILIVEAIAEIDFEEDFEDEDDEDDSEEEEHDCSTHAPGDHGHSHGKHSHEEHEHDGNGCCGNDEMPAMIAISLVNRAFAELAYPYLYKVSANINPFTSHEKNVCLKHFSKLSLSPPIHRPSN